MNLFTYLLAREGKQSLVHDDLFSYLLGKNKSQTSIVSGNPIYISDAKSRKIFNLVMDKESTQDGTPTPENPVEVTTVKGYIKDGNNYIDVKVQGKNLANLNLLFGDNRYYSVSGDNLVSAIANDVRSFTLLNGTSWGVSLIAGTYTISYNTSSTGQIQVYGKNYGQFVRTSLATGNCKITLTQDDIIGIKFIMNSYPYNAGHIQIEQGSIVTSYEDYQETIVPLPLNGNEIVGLGDYKDELIVDKNGRLYLNKKTGKKILNGSETYNYISSNHRFTLLQDIGMLDLNTTEYPKIGILSNEYIEYGTRETFDYGITRSNATSTYNYEKLVIANKDYSSANAFKQALSQNNVTVFYPLKNSTKIDLNTTVNLKLFNGINNITNSANCNMILEYYKNV